MKPCIAALERIMLCCILNADVSYVTFSKASEAALAIEEMNGKCLFDNPRPLKVIHSIYLFNLDDYLNQVHGHQCFIFAVLFVY